MLALLALACSSVESSEDWSNKSAYWFNKALDNGVNEEVSAFALAFLSPFIDKEFFDNIQNKVLTSLSKYNLSSNKFLELCKNVTACNNNQDCLVKVQDDGVAYLYTLLERNAGEDTHSIEFLNFIRN